MVDRRRMIRNYADRGVDPEIVERALRNATHAPSAGFSQGWGFLLLDTPEDVRRWWSVTTDPAALADPDDWLTGMMRAPVVIVPCSSKAAYLSRYAEDDKGWADRAESRWPVPFWHMDAAMASLLILQTAVDEGLGACFFGIPVERVSAVRTEFAIAEEFDPVGVITLGHRVTDAGNAGSPDRRARKSLDDIIHRGTWT
ncbi:MAG: nitroreductase [Marmoricola sp.]|nr:nitroreductase [Marmoricola sp.]